MSSKEKLTSSKNNSKDTHNIELPLATVRDTSAPTTSKNVAKSGPTVTETALGEPPPKRWWQKCWKYMYNRENKLYCDRSCTSWWYMIIYSVMYLIFLSTYTMIFLYATLTIIKVSEVYNIVDKSTLQAFTDNGIGLTATPTTLGSNPLIAYTNGRFEEYNKYINSLDELLMKRQKRQISVFTDLGPCAAAPYGYGNEPCIIIRPNKQLGWSAKPIKLDSTKHLPIDLQNWLELKEQKLWLHCNGYHSYDKEHIGSIKYYPYPPGFDPNMFPLDMQGDSPLVAIQISNFTLGLSLTVECKLWYDSGISSIAFLLYVEPKSRLVAYKNI